MKNLLTLFALITAFCHPERTTAQVINLEGTTTRAVVVGISDYQDEKISDLKYAHRDAIAFAAWLQSPAGGSFRMTKSSSCSTRRRQKEK